jgi:cell division protein FtsB
MRANAASHSGIRRWASYGLIFVAVAGLVWLSGYDALAELTDSWRKESEMQQAIEKLERENQRIEAAIGELAPEGKAVERIARQELGWAKRDEIVVKIPEKK